VGSLDQLDAAPAADADIAEGSQQRRTPADRIGAPAHDRAAGVDRARVGGADADRREPPLGRLVGGRQRLPGDRAPADDAPVVAQAAREFAAGADVREMIGGRARGRIAVDVEAHDVTVGLQTAKLPVPRAHLRERLRGDRKSGRRRDAAPAIQQVVAGDAAAEVGAGRDLQEGPARRPLVDGRTSPARELAVARDRARVGIAGADLREPRPDSRRRLLLRVRAPAEDRAVGPQTAREPGARADRRELVARWRRLPVAVEAPAARGPVVSQAARKVIAHGEQPARRHDHAGVRGLAGPTVAATCVARASVKLARAGAAAVSQRARIARAQTRRAEDGQDRRPPNHARTIPLSG